MKKKNEGFSLTTLRIFLIVQTIIGLLSFVAFLKLPASESENAVWLGLSTFRLFILVIFLLLWVLGIGVTLIKTQVFDYGKNIANVRKQSNRTFSLHPKRGTIYDNKGEVLAISIKAKSAFLSNKNRKEYRGHDSLYE